MEKLLPEGGRKKRKPGKKHPEKLFLKGKNSKKKKTKKEKNGHNIFTN